VPVIVHLVPGDQLPDQFRKPEGEDHEIDAGKPERRQPDQQRHGGTDQGRKNSTAG
jgi:hypothetical protein